ncbi:hypothetical protein [Methylobacterium sp. ID0610]|uniref:hypothetical protein n=1 Tax=Methylobacterium carpenticola TaxID=3344827 RepID=UPI0036BCC561
MFRLFRRGLRALAGQPDGRARCLGHIDAIDLVPGRLTIAGWANHLSPEILHDGRRLALSLRTSERLDVVAAHGQDRSITGFVLTAETGGETIDIDRIVVRLNPGCVFTARTHPSFFLSEAAVASLATAWAAADDAARTARLAELRQRARRSGEVLLLHRIGVFLRQAGHERAAEEALRACLDDPQLRVPALYELLSLCAYAGRHAAAAECIDLTRQHESIRNNLKLFAAVQYAHCGRAADALALIAEAVETDPGLEAEAAVTRQFVRMIDAYGKPEAVRLLHAVRSRFRQAGTEDVERAIIAHADAGRPFFVVRLGDGEASHIVLDPQDEEDFAAIYRQNRREMVNVWYRDPALLDDPRYRTTIATFNAAIADADCIGAVNDALIDHAYRMTTPMVVTWMVNTLRKLHQFADRDPDAARRTLVCDVHIHQHLLVSGALGRILQGRRAAGLISCHGELAPALQRHYGIAEMAFIKVPGEQIHADTLGPAAAQGRHWPDRYEAICAELDRGDRHGQIWLVAAGILGKIYGAKLKRSGAVVIDIGAVADLWMGKRTRSFPAIDPQLNPMTSLAGEGPGPSP